MPVERVSIEVTNRCAKGCWFCYNHSNPGGGAAWDPDDLAAFVADCAAHGVKAVSFGGEPLQYDGIFDVLRALHGRLFRSLTSNGLLLSGETTARLADARPDKVHLSIHFPEREAEVDRVIRHVGRLSAAGIRTGINLLVARSRLDAARRAAERARAAGIGNDRIVYLPMRGHGGRDTPTPREVSAVAGNRPFQSMSCLAACASSPRFCSVAWDHTVAWCSYTSTRQKLAEPTYRGLEAALAGLWLTYCGGSDGS